MTISSVLLAGLIGTFSQASIGSRTDELLRAGQDALRRQAYERAEVLFQELIEAEPQNARGHYYLGVCFLRRGMPGEAVEPLETAERLSASVNRAVLSELGTAYLQSGRPSDAVSRLTEASRISPQDQRLRMQLGWAYYQLIEGAKAKPLFESVLTETPENATAHFYLAMTEAALGNMDGAETHFREALRIEPALVLAKLGLGRVLSQLSRDQEAITLFEAALAEFPDVASSAHNELGLIRLRQGSLENALAHFEAVAAIEPDHRQAQYNQWLIHRRLGQNELAAKARERFMRIDENNKKEAGPDSLPKRSLSRTVTKKPPGASSSREHP